MKNILLLLTTLFASITMSATVHKVKASDGADVLKSTIAEAATGDTVLVQEGTFTGNFTMKDGVQVSGGWDANFETQTEYGTTLDANANGRVLNQPAAFSTLTVWSNFTIQNGKITTKQPDEGAAGVFLNKKGRVQDCLIQNNVVDVASGNAMGGGVSCNSGNADPDTVAYNCIIKNNTATHGGGVRVNGKGVVVYNCIIKDNQTTNNAAGGVHLHNGSKLINCIVRNNKANGDTGGVRLTGGNVSDIINCLIAGNEATATVGGICIEGNLPNIINNTIVGNKQDKSGATASLSGVKVKNDASANGTLFVNNIVWGNITGDTIAPQGVYYISRYDKTAGQRSYNAIQGQLGDDGATTCIKLTNADPGFVDAANGDYRLKETSKLVNSGNKTHNTLPTDLDGKQRVRGGKIDLGCYEFQSAESRDTYVKVGDNLQDSINLTVAGYTVYVQAGTFIGNFTMKDGVQVSGGWDANFETKTEYGTILDAQSNGRVLNQPDAFSVPTVWSNFTIQNGKLTAQPADKGGAGVWLNKNGQVKHCLIQNNTFTHDGTCMGGGVGNDVVNANTDVLVDDCIIRNNCATHGGGVRLRGTIQNSIIENNNTKDVKAGPAGGAHLQGGRMVNCIVRNNTSGGDTGGVRLYDKCQLIGSLIANNTATNTVGGVGIESANSDVIGNTIVCNEELKDQETVSKCGLSCGATDADNGCLSNNVIWGNKHRGVVQDAQIYYVSHYNNRDYNAVNKQTTNKAHSIALNPDNMAVDGPHFADPENGDFTILSTSVLVEGGDNTLATASKDLAGNNRIINGHVDYGCYEYTGAATLLNEKEESEFDEGETDVVMRRSFVADGSYYTLALPFAMSKEQIATVFGACQISELESSILKSETAENIELRLNFKNVQTIEANKPYLFLPQANVTNPVFEAVTLSKTANDVETDYADMKSILTPTTFEGLSDGAFFLGIDNILHPLDTEKSTVNAYRAYFELHSLEAIGGPKAVCARVSINGAPTELGQWNKDKGQRTIKVLRDGQLMIIRDNKTYNAQGNLVE